MVLKNLSTHNKQEKSSSDISQLYWQRSVKNMIILDSLHSSLDMDSERCNMVSNNEVFL